MDNKYDPQLTVFVGNISWGAGQEDLETLFSRIGNAVVDLKPSKDPKFPDSHRGFAFVTYETPEEADAAIRELNGADVDGRSIRVDRLQSRD